MKKLSNIINEGLWSKGIKRAQTGEERLEYKLPPNNLKEITPIDLDLPFLIADKPLKLNNKSLFTLNDVEKYLSNIERTGWRLPNIEDVNRLQKIEKSQLNNSDPKKVFVTLFSEDEKSFIHLNDVSDDFYVYDNTWEWDNGFLTVIFSKSSSHINFLKMTSYSDSLFYTIRLVKDK